MPPPKTITGIYEDFIARREGLLTALTEDVSEFFDQCDPGKANLCLYGHPDRTWSVDLPAEEVPPELPEPVLGINFARDGMERKDWLALCAVHSDAWLFSVLFFSAARFDDAGRAELFSLTNQHPTVYEVVTGRVARSKVHKRKQAVYGGRTEDAEPADAPLPGGRVLTYADLTPALKGRNAELFWPDDGKWYLVQVYSVNLQTREAQVQYATGEFEALNIDDVARDGHMSLLD